MHGEQHTLVTTVRARHRSLTAASAVVAAALLAVAPAAGAAPAHPGRAPATASSEQLNDIQAVSATDIWVLGQNVTTSAPLV
ncbi:MAG: hypothetical protein ACRDPO_28320 [Streptosporangiaceae bacterium]